MDIVERLTLEAAQRDTMLACEHRHRYEFAQRFCAGMRVLDLCCGSGYGTAALAATAREVVGVDNDAATVDMVQATVGRAAPNTQFETADAVTFLRRFADRFDLIVCFEGLEHLPDLERALTLLCEAAATGIRLILSVPNSKAFGEDNPFHLTDFGYDEALAAFADFPATVMLAQFVAEGSLICPPVASGHEVTLSLGDRNEPEYAHHFIFCVNLDPAEVTEVLHGKMQLSSAPIFNRWAQETKQALTALRRENARLARARLGKAGSAASSALLRLEGREAELAAWQQRSRLAEDRVLELERALAQATGHTALGPPAAPGDSPDGEPVIVAPETAAAGGTSAAPGSETWDSRHAAAAAYLVPWLEQTVPLTGKTVLDYGCADAAVSCALAAHARRVIAVGSDAAGIKIAGAKLRQRRIGNLELEQHSAGQLQSAVAAHRGQVDIFLLNAVLGHLTVAERLTVLRLAAEVVRPDGVIVIWDTPNRLIYFGHQAAATPFLHLLPDELAVEYSTRARGHDSGAAVEATAPHEPRAAPQAVASQSGGVSFHEFEVVFGDLTAHVVASNYDPALFPVRPVALEEVILARYLDRWRPDLAPVWSRSRLDLILSARPRQRRPSFLRPWTAHTIGSVGVAWSEHESLYLKAPDCALWVTLRHPADRVVVGAESLDDDVTLYLRGETMDAPLAACVSRHQPPRQAFASFDLPRPERRLALSANVPCTVVFIGYAD